eukprot:1146914-Pelagomonas_calceolata.AAC.8
MPCTHKQWLCLKTRTLHPGSSGVSSSNWSHSARRSVMPGNQAADVLRTLLARTRMCAYVCVETKGAGTLKVGGPILMHPTTFCINPEGTMH